MKEQELELAFVEECGDGRCGCGCGELFSPVVAISALPETTDEMTDVNIGRMSPPRASARP